MGYIQRLYALNRDGTIVSPLPLQDELRYDIVHVVEHVEHIGRTKAWHE